MSEGKLEPIYVAANVREADSVESVLEDEGVEFAQRLEPFLRECSGVCYQGTLFEVVSGKAEYCRRVLTDKGLTHGILILIVAFLFLCEPAQAFKGTACSAGKVTIHVRDQDIQPILRSFAEQTHLKIAVLPNLHAMISADFDCQDARYVFNALLAAANARYRIDGDVVRILPKRQAYEPLSH